MNKFVIFDMDGTLLDTLPGITKALNITLNELKEPYNYNIEEVRRFIGGGVKKLFKSALKRDYKDNELKLMLFNYEKYQYLSIVYNNVIETLNYLYKNNIKLFIYSNKPHNQLINLVNLKLDKNIFEFIQGDNFEFKNKPDPEFLNYLFLKFNLNPFEGYYVGDSEYDYLTSKNSKLKSIIVTYGYGDYKKIKELKPDYMIDDFIKIKEIIK